MLTTQYTPPAPPARNTAPRLSPSEAVAVACQLLGQALRGLDHDQARRQERVYLGQAITSAKRAAVRLASGPVEIEIRVERQHAEVVS